MAITESNVYGLWVAQQSAKGTAAASTAGKMLVQAGGDLDLNREDGSENYSDLTRFGNAVDFINTMRGEGTPSIHAQPDIVAFISYLFFGTETFTARTGTTTADAPPKFVFIPATNTGVWSTWWKRVGLTQVVRQKFSDAKITQLRIEGSTANKIVKVMPQVVSLNPGTKFDTDPTATQSTQRPFVYTEASGTIKIDTVSITGQTQFAITIDDNQTPVQGDSVTYSDFVAGNAAITMEGPTILLDAAGLNQYNKIIYGTTSPADGAVPLKTAPSVGAYEVTFTRGTGGERESLKIELPGVKWESNLAVAPNPDGGPIELALNGQMRKVTGEPAIRITVETGKTGQNLSNTP